MKSQASHIVLILKFARSEYLCQCARKTSRKLIKLRTTRFPRSAWDCQLNSYESHGDRGLNENDFRTVECVYSKGYRYAACAYTCLSIMGRNERHKFMGRCLVHPLDKASVFICAIALCQLTNDRAAEAYAFLERMESDIED